MKETTKKIIETAAQLRRRMPRRYQQRRRYRARLMREWYPRDQRKMYLLGTVLEGGVW